MVTGIPVEFLATIAFIAVNVGLAMYFRGSTPEIGRKLVEIEPHLANGIGIDLNMQSWNDSLAKFKNYLPQFEQYPLSKRNLVIFHIGVASKMDSLEVNINNLKFFSAGMLMNPSPVQYAVYVFNIIGGWHNPLLANIPTYLPNVLVLDWNSASSDMDTHLKTSILFGEENLKYFSAVFMFNQGVRGPFSYRGNGEWIQQYRTLLDANNVGMVGSTLSCEVMPHVQTHAFGVHRHMILNISNELLYSKNDNLPWLEKVRHFEIGFSKIVVEQGYKLASIMGQKRWNEQYFNGYCPAGTGLAANPTSWCNLHPQELMFMKWGGEPLRTHGYICEQLMSTMRRALANMSYNEPSLQLTVPETTIGGEMYQLYKEYTEEMFRDEIYSGHKGAYSQHLKSVNPRIANNVQVPNLQDPIAPTLEDEFVCILTRSASMHDRENVSSTNLYIETGIKDYIRSMLRQTHPHWKAFFFITDRNPFEKRLVKLLRHYDDNRLVYVAVPDDHLPHYSKKDAGYTPTDYVLKKILHSHKECKYLSISNADNVYGSDVVNRVLNSDRYSGSSSIKDPDLILNPLDSRNFADQDYGVRENKYAPRIKDESINILEGYLTSQIANIYNKAETIVSNHLDQIKEIVAKSAKPDCVVNGQQLSDLFVNMNNSLKSDEVNSLLQRQVDQSGVQSLKFQLEQAIIAKNLYENAWEKRCIGLNGMMFFNRLGYVSKPIPVVGRVDLASAFFLRRKLAKENLLFGNFTNIKTGCVGCQDGYFTEYLVHNRRWNYVQLPIGELKSIIFHGPSPSLCIASGNVWLDHPLVNRVGCMTHKTVMLLMQSESKIEPGKRVLDWPSYVLKNQHVENLCIRLSKQAYLKITDGILDKPRTS